MHRNAQQRFTLDSQLTYLGRPSDAQKFVHSFRPLVCLFSKQHETAESVQMAMDALDSVGQTYFGKRLGHAVAVMDHADGLRKGMLREEGTDRPPLKIASCWPHLARARVSA